ncbi:feruloyl-CoA synthase [Allomuricauda sp. NBRC 101325]|uniref:feruloyl-CoA synthase n=1 Tax=Allomuricauda sp. NBRC 101325 TaxID=1113758 RepID=UPI00249FBF41|nr:feruloyl-CoA synthase [Muricauda sp. NBRC 101325]GLU43952.1 feruloyl-CoA synthase [Muricauda sp. NBRC 101325]
MELKKTPFLDIPTLAPDIIKKVSATGDIILETRVALEEGSSRITDHLKYWVEKIPNKVFLAQRDENGQWEKVTYGEAWKKMLGIAAYLLQTPVSVEKPIAILSGNSVEHGLIALAAMHIGIPYSPISPAYSLRSTDYVKLKHCMELLTPGLIFVQNGKQFSKAIHAVASHLPVIAVNDVLEGQTSFDEVCKTEASEEVGNTHGTIQSDTIAKILFTSGSTGWPKGVINTHGNITTNWRQITQTFPFMKNGGLELIDWLPWNHTFGGNHNFGLTLYNGGTLYIDEGNPTPKGIKTTIQNLREVAPTVYFNVPKGFEELIPILRADDTLRNHFFSQLKMFFYAGASMPQHVWDGLEQLAYDTIGKRLLISTGLGMTEASPSALFNTEFGSQSGMLGVPVPGLRMKLVRDGDKLEARFKGGNLTPGYWRNPEATQKVFDEDGYYKTGDALKMVDENEPNKGMLFDGRISEDFKLDTGTWVRVGVMRSRLIKAGNGIIRDAVIAGHDESYISAIIILDQHLCEKRIGDSTKTNIKSLAKHPLVIEEVQQALNQLGFESTGSSTCIVKAIIADFELDMDKGEVTDKGSINQRAVLTHRRELVEHLYAPQTMNGTLEFKK